MTRDEFLTACGTRFNQGHNLKKEVYEAFFLLADHLYLEPGDRLKQLDTIAASYDAIAKFAPPSLKHVDDPPIGFTSLHSLCKLGHG